MNELERPWGRRVDDASENRSELLNEKGNAGSCDAVLLVLARAKEAGVSVSIWDLPKLTAVPLHEAFAAVRALEYGRLINVADNLSDPFGAILELREDGVDRLRDIKFA